MSKMSNINLTLQEQAEELGFSTVQEAIDNGYDVVYTVEKSKLISPQDQAHEAWLEEKTHALEGLEDLRKKIPYNWTETIDVLDRAIKFIKEAHD